MHFLHLLLAVVLLFSSSLGAEQKATLNFALLTVNGEQRSAFFEQIRKFERHYPSIKVNLLAVEQEQYKANFERWLKADSHSDLMFWFGGERLNWFVSQGLIEPLDAIWQRYRWSDKITTSARSAAEVSGQVYGLPIHYYNWGIYYNKSLFRQHALAIPENWEQFIDVCKKLKSLGLTPITMGSKETWPVAAWFDYLNLRLNGLPFHQQLMKGEISYHDARILNVFHHLGTLIEAGFFLEEHQQTSWKSALPYLYRDLAGMFLMGNFWTSQIPDPVKSKIGLFRFPKINPDLLMYEEAPTDLLVIPSNVKNRKEAEIFLNFMADETVQADLNEALGMLAPQKNNKQKKDAFLTVAEQILSEAEGVSQYYDRDNRQPIALKGMEQIKRFMSNTKDLPAVLEELERLRKLSF
jgi:multiple sugar transport system substrate-binding protein